jgi:hypothetical protein
MNRRIGWLSVISVALLIAAGGGVRGDEEKIPLEKLPKAVVEALKERFPDAVLKSAEKENEDGKVIYDVALTHDGKKYEAGVTQEGEIATIEKQIEAKDLPRAVADALSEKYPGATYSTIEEVYKVKAKKETLESYEIAVVTPEKKKLEVHVAPDGKIKKASEEKE